MNINMSTASRVVGRCFSGTCHLPNLATHSSWESDSFHPIKKYSSFVFCFFSFCVHKKMLDILKNLFFYRLNIFLTWKNLQKENIVEFLLCFLFFYLILSLNFHFGIYSFFFNISHYLNSSFSLFLCLRQFSLTLCKCVRVTYVKI